MRWSRVKLVLLTMFALATVCRLDVLDMDCAF